MINYMTQKFTFIYLKFILAATFYLLAYNSYQENKILTFKVIAFAMVAIAWMLLGIYNFRKSKINNSINHK